MATTDQCLDRFIQTRINLTYYDPTYFTNSLQNTIDHVSQIPFIDIYKSFNSTLTDDVEGENVNILYFTSQRPVRLTLICAGQTVLLTNEFYLYQPTLVFSFKIQDPGLTENISCSTYLQCFYAKLQDKAIIDEEIYSDLYDENYNPSNGSTL